jgi:hypothetical protein
MNVCRENQKKIENEMKTALLDRISKSKLEQLVKERTVDLEQKTIELQNQNQNNSFSK